MRPSLRQLALAIPAAAGAVALLLALVLEPPAHRRQMFEVALQDNAVFVQRGYYDRDLAFRQARSLGVSWIRATLLWSRVTAATARETTAPARIPYDWRQYDDFVRAAVAHRMHVELTITGPAPAWATDDHRIGVYGPNAELFARFAEAAAAHFRGRVSRYSIWNEPNYDVWLRPQRDAARLYRGLYERARAAIAAADPHAQVLIGETAGPAQPGKVLPALSFIRAVACRDDRYRALRRCPPLVADGYAHHPYVFAYPPDHRYPSPDAVTIGTTNRLAATLDELARLGALRGRDGGSLDIYLTEFGYVAAGRGGPPDSLRARYLVRAFDAASASYPRVRQLLQYLLLEPPPAYPGGSFDTGIVGEGGAESASYKALAGWARAAERSGSIDPP